MRHVACRRTVVVSDVVPGSGAAGILLGRPVFTDPFMPTAAAGARTILFGDWSRYWVRTVGGLRFERSDDFAVDRDVIALPRELARRRRADRHHRGDQGLAGRRRVTRARASTSPGRGFPFVTPAGSEGPGRLRSAATGPDLRPPLARPSTGLLRSTRPPGERRGRYPRRSGRRYSGRTTFTEVYAPERRLRGLGGGCLGEESGVALWTLRTRGRSVRGLG